MVNDSNANEMEMESGAGPVADATANRHQSNRLIPEEVSDSRNGQIATINTEEPKNASVASIESDKKGKDRTQWTNKFDFLMSIIGYAVDLSNVWRFPYLVAFRDATLPVYRNGGGAFFIPYIIFYIFLGMPVFYLELLLGQYNQRGAIGTWGRTTPLLKGIGIASVTVSLLVGFFYNQIIAYAVYMFIVSLTEYPVPFSHCNNTYNTDNCLTKITNATIGKASPSLEFFQNYVLKSQNSTGVDDLGGMNWPLFGYYVVVLIMIYLALVKGITLSGKVVWFTAGYPYLMLTVLLVRGCMLDGSGAGIAYYVTPQFERLTEFKIWVDAGVQVFFSLGAGFGVLIAFSSYNPIENNVKRDAIIAAFVNAFTSILAGFVIFAALGHMAHESNTPIDKVAPDGPGLVFIAYPQILATFPGANAWAAAFFLMVVFLGLDSSMGGMESVLTGLSDDFPRLRKVKWRGIVLGAITVLFLAIGIPNNMNGGYYLINLYDQSIAAFSLLAIVACEVIALCWVYGSDRLSEDIVLMTGSKPNRFLLIIWKFVIPLALITILIATLVAHTGFKQSEPDNTTYFYPIWAELYGWFLTLLSISAIPFTALYMLRQRGDKTLSLWGQVKQLTYPLPSQAIVALRDKQMTERTFVGEGNTSDYALQSKSNSTVQKRDHTGSLIENEETAIRFTTPDTPEFQTSL